RIPMRLRCPLCCGRKDTNDGSSSELDEGSGLAARRLQGEGTGCRERGAGVRAAGHKGRIASEHPDETPGESRKDVCQVSYVVSLNLTVGRVNFMRQRRGDSPRSPSPPHAGAATSGTR